MTMQITEDIAPAARLYATYGACLHQAAATHKDSGEPFRFSFDDAIIALDADNIMVMSLYEMYSQGLQEWRAKWETAGERPPCLEADPTPFILEEERVAMERAVKLLKELRDDLRDIGTDKTQLFSTPQPAYVPPTIITYCPDPTAANAVETVRRYEMLPNEERREVPITREQAEAFVKVALAAVEKGRKV